MSHMIGVLIQGLVGIIAFEDGSIVAVPVFRTFDRTWHGTLWCYDQARDYRENKMSCQDRA